MATRFTLAQFRILAQDLLSDLQRQNQAKLLRPGAYDQIQWAVTKLDKALAQAEPPDPIFNDENLKRAVERVVGVMPEGNSREQLITALKSSEQAN